MAGACPCVQIGAGQVAEAIEWGRSRVVPLVGGGAGGAGGTGAAADRELLEDATALLAYDEPATGPTGESCCCCCREGGSREGVGPWRGPATSSQRCSGSSVPHGLRAAGEPAARHPVQRRCQRGLPATDPNASPAPSRNSPAGYLLQAAHRAELAAAVNRAVLAYSGRGEDSALERISRQATEALAELKKGGHPAAAMLDVAALLQAARDEGEGRGSSI